MPLVSVTRLHLSGWRYVPGFIIYTVRSVRQVRRSRGFRAGFLAGDAQRGSWTVTLWDSEEDMRAFRNAAAHLAAMPRLLTWCDEASYTHWEVGADAAALPTAEEAYARLRDEGKTSKVRHPSLAHRNGRTVSDSAPRVAKFLHPR
jgi:hypothetical protein